MFPIATEIASRLTRDHAQSAMPHAPTLDEAARPTAPRPRGQPRLVVARMLRRLADRVEPAPARAPAREPATPC